MNRLVSFVVSMLLIVDVTLGISIPPYTEAQVFLIKNKKASSQTMHYKPLRKQPLAMAIPGYGLTEQIFVGGFQNFLSIYNAVITVRILLSWFPQAQGVGALQPVYAITDPYLNLFRGLIPPVFGLDLSPILAFFALNVATSATAALGCEIKPRDYNYSCFKQIKGKAKI